MGGEHDRQGKQVLLYPTAVTIIHSQLFSNHENHDE